MLIRVVCAFVMTPHLAEAEAAVPLLFFLPPVRCFSLIVGLAVCGPASVPESDGLVRIDE